MAEGKEGHCKEKQHFVMVHGVGHGAWCWFKVQHLLESSGHKVSCLDLAGAGINAADPNSILSFEDYDQPLFDFMSALPHDEKVVLVGHSAGGLNVTKAIHDFGNKISLAIFIAATMLPSGFLSDQDLIDGVPNLSEYGDVYELQFGLVPDNPPTSVALKKEFQRMILYQLSPKEDSSLASMLLRPWPYAISKARFRGEKENVNNVRRVYIKTMYDNMVKPEQQEAMIRRWPPNEVMIMKTDHSPFFSASEELFNLIIKASSFC
ncbi:hypothetical protein J5N97_017438 [Dioscorea zingiberensis]|uniref:AB hydrolase-1 domain-containing protein n=1 Tax=Dioscorea zingiberensis TaxID=325984 RepID=A0A9D5CN75_9LILI|nr:hypothetical protein J5N97_017438 [Dioscorea zingiberensis]